MRRVVFLASFIFLVFSSRAVFAQTALPDNKQAAAAAFEQGQTFQQRGALEAAVMYYTTAITADPTLFQAYYQRATALIGLTREAEAEADLKRVIQVEPNFARAHRALGQIWLDRGKTEDAKRELARAIELEPGLTGIRIYYASALLKSGEPQRAIEHLRFAIQQREDMPLAYALLGVAEERLGKSDEALSDYSRAVELDAGNATAHEGRGRLFESRGDLTKAIEEYSAAYRAQPSREAAIHLAELHTRGGRPQAAIQLYRRLLLDRPDDLAVRADMACLLAENGQGEEAEREMLRVITAKPGDAKLLARAGDLFFKEKPAQAAEYYRKAVAADPNHNGARIQLGVSLLRAMQYDAAMSALKEALTREPGNYDAHAGLATVLFKLKQYPQAAGEFVWIIRAKPDVAASYFFLGISLDHLGDCEQALKSYKEFVRRADAAANKNEIEEANSRSTQLQRLIKEGKCKSANKAKSK